MTGDLNQSEDRVVLHPDDVLTLRTADGQTVLGYSVKRTVPPGAFGDAIIIIERLANSGTVDEALRDLAWGWLRSYTGIEVPSRQDSKRD